MVRTRGSFVILSGIICIGSQGSLLFVTYTIIQSIISSEMQVELKKNTVTYIIHSFYRNTK